LNFVVLRLSRLFFVFEVFLFEVLLYFKMAECLSFFDVIEGKSSQLSFKVAVGKSIDI